MSNFDDSEFVDPKHLAPLEIDPSSLHGLIDDLTRALHEYVDTAVGIRAEFDAATAEDDPRIESVEDRVGELNARIAEHFETDLGFVSAHTTQLWDDDDEDDDDGIDLRSVTEGSVFEMGFLVVPTPTAEPIETAFSLVEAGGERVAQELAAAGFEVQEWGASRTYIDDEDADDEDDDTTDDGVGGIDGIDGIDGLGGPKAGS